MAQRNSLKPNTRTYTLCRVCKKTGLGRGNSLLVCAKCQHHVHVRCTNLGGHDNTSLSGTILKTAICNICAAKSGKSSVVKAAGVRLSDSATTSRRLAPSSSLRPPYNSQIVVRSKGRTSMTSASNTPVAPSSSSETNCELASTLNSISNEILGLKNLLHNLKAEIEKIHTATVDEKAERNVISFRYAQINQKLDFLIRNNNGIRSTVLTDTNGSSAADEEDFMCSNNVNNLNMNQNNTSAAISEINNNNNNNKINIIITIIIIKSSQLILMILTLVIK